MTSQDLLEKAQKAAELHQFGIAAEAYLEAGKLLWESARCDEAVSCWRRACEFCEAEANRLFQLCARDGLH